MCPSSLTRLLRQQHNHLSQVEEEAGVLAGLGQVGQEDGDADEEDGGVLTHLPQRLPTRAQVSKAPSQNKERRRGEGHLQQRGRPAPRKWALPSC